MWYYTTTDASGAVVYTGTDIGAAFTAAIDAGNGSKVSRAIPPAVPQTLNITVELG